MQESHIARVAENEAKLKKDGYRLEGSIPAIDNDAALQALDDQIGELYSSYYEFDSHGQACWFNEEQKKADKPLMLEPFGIVDALGFDGYSSYVCTSGRRAVITGDAQV